MERIGVNPSTTKRLFLQWRTAVVTRDRSERRCMGDVAAAEESAPAEANKRLSPEALRRRRRTEWKRKQQGGFLDHLIITVRGGRGGDGCVAFHREKFKPFGPPSGGNGGIGGSVYIAPSPHLTSLAAIPKRVVAGNGSHGQGTWQHGRAGADVTIHVPYGTVIREIVDSRRAKDPWEAEEESYTDQGVSEEERREKMRERRWVHYPEFEEHNVERDEFRHAEAALRHEERERRMAELERRRNPITLEFEGRDDVDPEAVKRKEMEELTRPLGLPRANTKGTLIAAGGAGGHGNPYFLTSTNRSPKWATRGNDGTRITLELELKLVADVGLVGFPNAGKSTLLNALTKRRAEVASYAFTTLNPQIGTVRVLPGGDFDGAGGVIEESRVERERGRAALSTGVEQDARKPRAAYADEDEVFRFTIADNPGLISRASENVGLGHDFLRSIERARALAYVVDLSGEAPWDELDILRKELDAYKEGLAAKCRIVIANKADLLGPRQGKDQNPNQSEREEETASPAAQVEAAKAKLTYLQSWVKENLGPLDVIPVSAKYSQNLRRIVQLLSTYISESRKHQKTIPTPLSSFGDEQQQQIEVSSGHSSQKI